MVYDPLLPRLVLLKQEGEEEEHLYPSLVWLERAYEVLLF